MDFSWISMSSRPQSSLRRPAIKIAVERCEVSDENRPGADRKPWPLFLGIPGIGINKKYYFCIIKIYGRYIPILGTVIA